MTELLEQLIGWLQRLEIGEGDLTTESVAPHALYVKGEISAGGAGLLCGQEIVDRLLESARPQLELRWLRHDGAQLQDGTVICQLEGNGAEILQNRRLIVYFLERLSGLASATRNAADFLAQYGKKLTASRQTEPFWEIFDRTAYILGGMEIHHQALQDSIYLTPLHFAYAGSPDAVIRRVGEELGEIRKKYKIEVEVNNLDLLNQVNACDCDVIHLVDFSKEEIQRIFTRVQFNRRPVLHLKRLEDFEPEYADYFFRYTVIEELHLARHVVKMKINFNPKEQL